MSPASPARCVLSAGSFTTRDRVQWLILKGTVTRDFWLSDFFHESSSPKPLGETDPCRKPEVENLVALSL